MRTTQGNKKQRQELLYGGELAFMVRRNQRKKEGSCRMGGGKRLEKKKKTVPSCDGHCVAGKLPESQEVKPFPGVRPKSRKGATEKHIEERKGTSGWMPSAGARQKFPGTGPG